MMVLVTYDVNTELPEGRKRLREVSKTCCKYGQRVQNSVFECNVTPSDYLQLKHKLNQIINPEQDSLRFYTLGSRYDQKIEYTGTQRHLPENDVMMI